MFYMPTPTKVLVIAPMRSPTTGRELGWTSSHTLDCWVPKRSGAFDYEEMDASDVPADVERCAHCGGGR